MKPGVSCMLSHFSCVQLFAMLWTVAHQAPLSMGFSRQEYWWGLLVPSPGNLPNPGIKPVSPVSYIGRRVLYRWATRETHLSLYGTLQVILCSCASWLFSSFLRRGRVFTISLQAEYWILNLHSEPGEDSWLRDTMQPFLMELAYLLTALVWWRNAAREPVFNCINWIL